MVSRLVGGVLSRGRSPVGDHPSVRPTWPIGRATRGTLGLAPSGGCRAAGVAPDAGALLPHRFTLTCAVSSRRCLREDQPSAVCFLLPLPTGRPVLALASALLCGAPTFLSHRPKPATAITGPTHHRERPACQLPASFRRGDVDGSPARPPATAEITTSTRNRRKHGGGRDNLPPTESTPNTPRPWHLSRSVERCGASRSA